MKRNRILFILHYPPPVHGSSVMGLQIKESKIINAVYGCSYLNLGTSKTIDEIGKNAIGKIFRYMSILWKVAWNLIARRPDLCYLAITAQGIGFYKDVLVVFLIKLFRVRLVYHFHNKGVSNKQQKPLDNFLYRFVFKNADVILLSQYLYPDIQKYVSINAVHLCPNGIPDIKINDRLTCNRQGKRTVSILFLSNLLESKGVFVLLEACKLLKNRNLDFKCTFVGGVGDVNEQQFQSKLQQLALTDYVDYAGKKYGKEKEVFFSEAHIFAFPTLNETFGIVNLEAMQYELPVVSTSEGGIPDVVEDSVTGFLVPKKDSNALAEKLEILILNNDLREKMGRNGRLRYELNFTLHHFEHNLNAILKQCLLKSS